MLTIFLVALWGVALADLPRQPCQGGGAICPIGYGPSGSACPLVRSVTLPNQGFLTNHFDSLDRLDFTGLETQWGQVLDGYTYGYNQLGLRTNIFRNFGLATSTVSARYDAIGQLTSWSATEANTAPRLNEQLGWGYDAAGNLHYRTNDTGLLQTFTVDAANELSSVASSGTLTVAGSVSPVNPPATVTVSGTGLGSGSAAVYADGAWARPGANFVSGQNTYTASTTDSLGHAAQTSLSVNLAASATLQYDLNGNLTNDGLRSFQYDSESQLTRAYVPNQWRSDFLYDGLGRRRIQRDWGWQGGWVQTNETHYVYDRFLVLQERDANNNVKVTYTRGLDLSGTLQYAGGIGGPKAIRVRSKQLTITEPFVLVHGPCLGRLVGLFVAQSSHTIKVWLAVVVEQRAAA